jgi:hypothetical protein
LNEPTLTILRITNPLEPGRDAVRTKVAANGTLERVLAGHVAATEGMERGFEDWARNYTVALNGHVWPPSLWSEITPRDGDTVTLAPLVRGGSLLRTLATVAVLAAAAVTAAFAGPAFAAFLGGLGATISAGAAGAILAGAVSVAGNLLISAFGSNQPNNKQSSASYDADGPKMLAGSGSVIPKAYGTFQWSGNCISSYTDIAGQDQYINALVCFGFGPARSITNVQINGKDIAEYQNATYSTRLGANGQTEIAQFNQIVNGYQQTIQCLAGIPVVVPGTGDLTQSLQVDIQFPDGIFVITNDGNKIPAFVTYKLEYAPAGTGAWVAPLFPNNTASVYDYHLDGSAYLPYAWGLVATDQPPGSGIVYDLDNGPHTPGDPGTKTENVETINPDGTSGTVTSTFQGEWQLLDASLNYVNVLDWFQGWCLASGAQTTTMYFRTAILGLPAGKYDVRVTKYGSARTGNTAQPGDNFSPNMGQDMWVHQVNEVSYQDLAYPNLILLGVRAMATSQLSGSGLNISALVEHGLRSKDEGLLPAELLSYEEDNPACVAADMLLDDLYGGGALPEGQAPGIGRYIDQWVGWAENNDTLVPDGNGNSIRMCVFNGVFDNEDNLWNQLGVVGAMSRAAIIPVGTDYGVAVDKAEATPVQMFTVGNVTQDSFSETFLQIDDRATQIEIQFADQTRYYREDNPLAYMDPTLQNTGAQPKIVRIRGKGITVPAQAWHHARYKYQSNALLLRTGSFSTDTEGLAVWPFNVIALQHDVPQWGQGGRTLPGSSASLILPDRDDIAFAAGTSYSLMVLHPTLERWSGTATAVAASSSPPGYTLTVPGWANTARATRAVLFPAGSAAGIDCAVLDSAAGSVAVSPPTGFVPLAGQAVALWDTDVIETAPVSGIDPLTGGIQLGTPLSQAPADFSQYIYGITGATKWARLMNIKRQDYQRSTIEWIDYSADVYTIATPIIGETSAASSSKPGVTSLTGSEIIEQTAGNYVSYASLSWQNGPDTVGVGIFVSFAGMTGQPQLVARLTGSPASWQGQQAPGTTYTYSVVGFDVNNAYAGFASAPSVTLSAVGVTTNLLNGSTFASGFTYWNVNFRAGDAFTTGLTDGGEALYTVAGSAISAAQPLLSQIITASKWTAGQYLMLSGYVEDTAVATPNTGSVLLSIVFTGSSGTTSTSIAAPLSGVSPTLTRYNTAAVEIPAGTTQVAVTLALGGTGIALPVASTVTLSHMLLELATAGQTVPSTWADIDINGAVLDLFQTGSSTGLRVQGSTLPTFTGGLAYTATPDTATIAWTGLVILWPDSSYTTIQDNSATVTGLTAGNYLAYLYYDVAAGMVAAANPVTPHGAPPILSAAADVFADASCRQDGRVPLTPGGLAIVIPSSGSGGGSGGGGLGTTGGGGGSVFGPVLPGQDLGD